MTPDFTARAAAARARAGGIDSRSADAARPASAGFAELYAGLDVGTWYPAASLADYFRAWLTRHPDRRRGVAPLRGLDTTHFEFRGGTPREPPWLPGHPPMSAAEPAAADRRPVTVSLRGAPAPRWCCSWAFIAGSRLISAWRWLQLP